VYLFFDTETTGIPRNWKAPASDLANWPRLVQMAWVECEESGEVTARRQFIVRPDGFSIPPNATRVHGITTERASREGVAVKEVLEAFTAAAGASAFAIAHNLDFDEKVLGAEFLRAGLTNPLPRLSRLCTMRTATDYCRLPGRYGYKWPTLEELYRHLFDETLEGSHDAATDALACSRCFFELRRLEVL
jgi:DNA polymerase III epsilon subunit-like protein